MFILDADLSVDKSRYQMSSNLHTSISDMCKQSKTILKEYSKDIPTRHWEVFPVPAAIYIWWRHQPQWTVAAKFTVSGVFRIVQHKLYMMSARLITWHHLPDQGVDTVQIANRLMYKYLYGTAPTSVRFISHVIAMATEQWTAPLKLPNKSSQRQWYSA